MSDESDKAVGAVLQQQIDDEWRPLSYFSKKLRPAETRYGTFDRELLAVYLSIKHFRHLVEGREVHVVTDHKPLTFALATSPDKYTPRQIRHLDYMYIAQFTSDIRHIAGLNNPVANALSRNAVNTLHNIQLSQVDLQVLAQTQTSDPELQALLNSSSTSLQLTTLPLPASSSTMICDTSTGSPHPFVPTPLCRTVFTALHSLAHPGVRATQQLIGERFVWPGMRKDIKSWTRTCMV